MGNELKYIDPINKQYTQAKRIRIECFFKGMDDPYKLINDEFEKVGIHLICLNENQQVIGTGRLHTSGSTGIISQMAIRKENQRTGIGKKILNELIQKCEALGMRKIELSARDTALEFYENYGFKAFGKKYLSIKTGIMHQKMSMNIKNVG